MYTNLPTYTKNCSKFTGEGGDFGRRDFIHDDDNGREPDNSVLLPVISEYDKTTD